MTAFLTELTASAVAPSPIVSDLIASLLTARAPISLATRFDAREEAAAWLAAHAADLVVVGAPADAADEIAASLVVLSPDATVLVLPDEGRTTKISAVGVPPAVLVDVSADRLAEAVLASIRQHAPAKRRGSKPLRSIPPPSEDRYPVSTAPAKMALADGWRPDTGLLRTIQIRIAAYGR
jgi:DNA-binding NarL/FixJ family response regulator